MEQITNYVKPELIVVAIALYFVGMALKQAQITTLIPPRISGMYLSFTACACLSDQNETGNRRATY